jgi:hypothetical protein
LAAVPVNIREDAAAVARAQVLEDLECHTKSTDEGGQPLRAQTRNQDRLACAVFLFLGAVLSLGSDLLCLLNTMSLKAEAKWCTSALMCCTCKCRKNLCEQRKWGNTGEEEGRPGGRL